MWGEEGQEEYDSKAKLWSLQGSNPSDWTLLKEFQHDQWVHAVAFNA